MASILRNRKLSLISFLVINLNMNDRSAIVSDTNTSSKHNWNLNTSDEFHDKTPSPSHPHLLSYHVTSLFGGRCFHHCSGQQPQQSCRNLCYIWAVPLSKPSRDPLLTQHRPQSHSPALPHP